MKTMMINSKDAKVEYNETLCPKMILDEQTLEKALNSVLVVRYYDENTVARFNANTRFEKATKDMNEYVKDSKEYSDAMAKHDKAYADIMKYDSILESLKAEKATFDGYTIPDDIAHIVDYYSMIYSTCAGIDLETNKVKSLQVKSSKYLFESICRYADTYENMNEWTETQKADFTSIRETLNSIGSYINGDVTVNRKKFSYNSGVKDVNQLIALCTKHANVAKKTGKNSDKRVNFTVFHQSLIATIFRIPKESLQAVNVVEIG